MKINIQAVNFNAHKDLLDFVNKKVAKIEVLSDKILRLDIYMKSESASEKDGKVVEFKLKVSGDEFVVKKKGKSFEEAVALSVDSTRRFLRRYKDRK